MSESRTSRFTKIEPVLHMLKYVCLNHLLQFQRYAGACGYCMPSCRRSYHKTKIWLKYAGYCYSHYDAGLRTCACKECPAAEKAHPETVHKKYRMHFGSVNKNLESKDSCGRRALRRSRITYRATSAVLFPVKNTEQFVI